ncbi:MAG: dihydrofolate reductase, partial [Pseudomonadota bacterium]
DDNEPFLIGGAELYKEGIKLANKLYLTEVHADFKGDAFFEQIDLARWHEVGREKHIAENGLQYSYVSYLAR